MRSPVIHLVTSDLSRPVASAINAQNTTLPGGRVDTSRDYLTLRVEGRVASVDELRGIIVREQAGRAIRLDEIADVKDTVQDADTSALWNGERTVLLAISKQSGQNTVEVVDAVKSRMQDLQKELPQGYSLEVQRDAELVDLPPSTRRNLELVQTLRGEDVPLPDPAKMGRGLRAKLSRLIKTKIF